MDHPLMPQHVDRLDSHTPEVPTRPPWSKAPPCEGEGTAPGRGEGLKVQKGCSSNLEIHPPTILHVPSLKPYCPFTPMNFNTLCKLNNHLKRRDLDRAAIITVALLRTR